MNLNTIYKLYAALNAVWENRAHIRNEILVAIDAIVAVLDAALKIASMTTTSSDDRAIQHAKDEIVKIRAQVSAL